MLDKKWWERWQVYAGCSEDVDAAAASGESDDVGHVEEDAPAGAAGAGAAGAGAADAPAAAAAEDAEDDVAVAAGAAAAETAGTPGDGDSATAEETATLAAAATTPKVGEEGPNAVPPCVSVGDGGGDGDGDGDVSGKGGGVPAKTDGEARTSGDRTAGVMSSVHATVFT